VADLWRRAGVYLDIVYTFPAAVGVGTGAGWLADHYIGTKPYLTLLGFFLGLLGGFWYLFKMLGVFKGRRKNNHGS
jgi:F0F1-type ATP synthase assembly protein I